MNYTRCACCTSSNINKKSSQNTYLKYCIPIIYSVNVCMQGKKIYQEKPSNQFRLSDRVPENNFYSWLKAVLNLEYLYQLTKEYYGDSGQKSVDPVVFYILCLVGYVENIISDKNLITHCRKKKSFQLPIIAINMSAITNA